MRYVGYFPIVAQEENAFDLTKASLVRNSAFSELFLSDLYSISFSEFPSPYKSSVLTHPMQAPAEAIKLAYQYGNYNS